MVVGCCYLVVRLTERAIDLSRAGARSVERKTELFDPLDILGLLYYSFALRRLSISPWERRVLWHVLKREYVVVGGRDRFLAARLTLAAGALMYCKLALLNESLAVVTERRRTSRVLLLSLDSHSQLLDKRLLLNASHHSLDG